MKILALSGWGQPHDALSNITPDATHFDYAQYDNVDIALEKIAEAARSHDAIIGWSLGGQLAVRAATAVPLKKLVLIGAPFQFVESPDKKLGMKRDQYEKFRDNYAKNPARTLAKAWELVAKGDVNEDTVRGYMQKFDPTETLTKHWYYWFNAFDGYSAEQLNFSTLPPTLLIHGKNDAVVEHAQSREFANTIPLAKQHDFSGSGHAPHWHDESAVRDIIGKFLHV